MQDSSSTIIEKYLKDRQKYMIRQVLRPPAEEAVVAEEAEEAAPSREAATDSKYRLKAEIWRNNRWLTELIRY